MDIPRKIKDDPRWIQLTPKVRTNIGKLLQPYRTGQLVEYNNHFEYTTGKYVSCKGIIGSVAFEFWEKNDSPKKRHADMQRNLFITFYIMRIWDGRVPVVGEDNIVVTGTTDVAKFLFAKTLAVLCEPE